MAKKSNKKPPNNSTKSVPFESVRNRDEKTGRFYVKYEDNFPDLLIDHMAQGFSFASFGGVVRVSEQTLFNWLDNYEDFREAKRIGKALSRNEWEKIGKDGLHEILQKDAEGNINKLKLNSTIYLANMRNRFGWDKPEKDNDKKPQEININFTKAERK